MFVFPKFMMKDVMNKLKKKLLFVIDSLDVAGAEKSLVTLLSMLDYSKYTVDLQLFAYGHALEELIPKEVKVLKPLKYTNFSNLGIKDSMKRAALKGEYNMFISRMKYSIKIHTKKYSNPYKAMHFWKSVANVIEKNPQTYDIAISYAQGIPTYYVADKVKAEKKITWVNVSYSPDELMKKFQSHYYNQYHQIVVVSDSTKERFLNTFPNYEDKVTVLFDINNPDIISNMAEIGSSYNDDFVGTRILTVGRLAHQKGYDIALEACKQLKEAGVNFKWYALGKGPLKSEIEAKIKRMKLTNHFILLGVKANPYAYYKDADIYVQTSRFEGFGLAIAEARMLNVPVVTTEFDAVYNQMVHEKNGLVTSKDGIAIAEAIQKIINNYHLKQRITTYLQAEKKGNVEEIEKFYQLIGYV